MMDRGNLRNFITQKGQIPKLSSWEVNAAEFVNKVKDQVRRRQKRMSNVADSGEEHSIIWGMLMAATMNAATFMGKNFSCNQNFIMNSRDLTLKHMFDITAKLVGEQEEINNLDNIHWGKNSWRQLSLIGDETVVNLQRKKVYVFSDSDCNYFKTPILQEILRTQNPLVEEHYAFFGSHTFVPVS